MATTPNIQVTEVDQSQSQKVVTINEAFIQFDNAQNRAINIDISGGATTVNDEQFNNNAVFIFGGTPGSPTAINIPARSRFFGVDNQSDDDIVITPTGTGTIETVTVPAGEQFLVHSDGSIARCYGAGGAESGGIQLPAFIPGTIPAPSQILNRLIVTSDFTIPANSGLILSEAFIAPTNATGLSVRRNGITFGTIDFAAESTTGVFSSSAPEVFTSGDIIEIQAAALVDPTFADISITIGASS